MTSFAVAASSNSIELKCKPWPFKSNRAVSVPFFGKKYSVNRLQNKSRDDFWFMYTPNPDGNSSVNSVFMAFPSKIQLEVMRVNILSTQNYEKIKKGDWWLMKQRLSGCILCNKRTSIARVNTFTGSEVFACTTRVYKQDKMVQRNW